MRRIRDYREVSTRTFVTVALALICAALASLYAVIVIFQPSIPLHAPVPASTAQTVGAVSLPEGTEGSVEPSNPFTRHSAHSTPPKPSKTPPAPPVTVTKASPSANATATGSGNG
jgi:hypothetical protein